mgnify:CR=1 FL=1
MELTYVPYKELERIRNLQGSRVERTQLFATLARLNTLYMIMQAGSGHIGSSFSAMDIVSWLYLNEMELSSKPDGFGDIYFSSKGHDAPGLYSVLLGLGRLDFNLLHKLRRLNGLPGPPDVITPGIHTNTGSLGMGISKAKGMALAHRLQDKKARIFVLTGDGELQEGQNWESLASAVHHGLSEITVVVDHNKIQSDTWVSLVNDLGDLIIAEMSPAGYEEISRAHVIDPTHTVWGRKIVWSHPAFANKSVYYRNDKEIVCISLAAEKPAE